jgi:hypothetical protein
MPPSTDYFLYLIDESPNTAQTEQWAQWILQNPGPGQRLRSMATISLPTAAAAKTPSLGIPTSFSEVGVPTRVRYRPTCARSRDTAWRSWSAKVPGYNLHIMLVVLGCVIGLAAVIGIARAMRARSTFNENRVMRDYLRRIASDSNSL